MGISQGSIRRIRERIARADPAREEKAAALLREADLPTDWEEWLREMFPSSVTAPFADHHRDYWEWLWAVGPERPRPFAALWPRGGGKSSASELAAATVACRGTRNYVLYVSETQDQANKRVQNIGTLLESGAVGQYYPSANERAVGLYGTPKAWRRNRLHTGSGFVIDALGMDTAGRGMKVDDQRPDFIILDEIDGRHDTPRATARKIVTITETILPMGAGNTAVAAVQNVMIPDGIFGRIGDGRAEFLADRIVSGPIPAVLNLKTHRWGLGEVIPADVVESADVDLTGHGVNEGEAVRTIITSGSPTWPGQGLAACQGLIDASNFAAFKREQQHEVYEIEGAMWTRAIISHVATCPSLKRVVTGVDPSGGTAEIGIITAGIGFDGKIYVIADDTQAGSKGPANWGRSTVDAHDRHEGDRIVAEKNFGGDMVAATIQVAAPGRRLPVKMVTASRGKAVRAEPVVALYEEGRVFHVGAMPELETEMTQWVPGIGDSPNRVDALVWAITELNGQRTAFFWGVTP